MTLEQAIIEARADRMPHRRRKTKPAPSARQLGAQVEFGFSAECFRLSAGRSQPYFPPVTPERAAQLFAKVISQFAESKGKRHGEGTVAPAAKEGTEPAN